MYLPTIQMWDVTEIGNIDISSDEFRELLLRMYQNLNRMAMAVNIKDSAYYDTDEFVNGQKYFPNPAYSSATSQYPVWRQVYRKVVNFGALPNAAAKVVAHGITTTAGFIFTRMYGCSTDPVAPNSYIPLPYASPTLNQNISLQADNTNVTITTAINYSSHVTTYVVLEYIKS